MSRIPFDEKELEVVSEFQNPRRPEAPVTQIYRFPTAPKEAFLAAYREQPLWQITDVESGIFSPKVIPDDVARGFVFEAEQMDSKDYGGRDMFGVEWEYVPVVGGSMVRPGQPILEDANEWKEKLVWPDIHSWDWDASGKANRDFLNNGKANMLWLLNGCWYERLISFLDFENAAVSMIDEEQKDAVKELFSNLTDLYCDIVDKCVETYGNGIAGFTVHDDWGAQKDAFFSPATAREMIVPYMQRLTAHIKSKGMIADLHSCGHIERHIQNIIDAGWQSWTPMPMNDTHELYEKYGDKILIGVCQDLPAGITEAEQEKLGADYAKKYFKAGKTCTFSLYSSDTLTPAFRRGLYTASRKMA